MKELIIPIKNINKNNINICEITPEFKGIIIAYINNIPVGYITCNCGDWCIYKSIDAEDIWEKEEHNLYMRENLLDLCQELMKHENITNFKVLEFGN